MSATSQVTDLNDLRTEVISAVREQSGVTSINNVVDRYINRALHDIHINPGNIVPWAIRSGTLTTHATYTTGTASITIATSRTAVTGASTAWNTAVTGYSFNNVRARGKIVFSGELDVYSVASVSGNTALVLGENYIGTSNLSAASYTYFEDEYVLASDFLRPVDLRSFSTELNISLIGAADFRRTYPRNAITGPPKVATTIQLAFSGSTTPRLRVVFHPAPEKIYLIPYDYVTSNLAVSTAGAEQAQLSAATDEPIIPLRYRHLIVYRALADWYREQMDDKRSGAANVMFIDLMARVKGDTTIGQDRPRFMPWVSWVGATHPRRRGSRWASGTWFDQLRNR